MSVDPDFGETFGGIFFDRHVRQREDCLMVLVDWKFPNGHELRRCKTYYRRLVDGAEKCPKKYGLCGGEELHSQCSKCGTSEESEDGDAIAFNIKDKL